jgi:hypothetical protein
MNAIASTTTQMIVSITSLSHSIVFLLLWLRQPLAQGCDGFAVLVKRLSALLDLAFAGLIKANMQAKPQRLQRLC